LHAAASIGYVLFRLAQSAAIEKHFKSIEPLLTDPCHDEANDVKLEEITKGIADDPESGDDLYNELYDECFGKLEAEISVLNAVAMRVRTTTMTMAMAILGVRVRFT
jgi:hypothetical protein